MDVTDPATGKQAEDAKLQVYLSTSEELDMYKGPHPSGDTDPVPEFWTGAYEVTEDTPTGILNYSVTAKFGDKKGEFKPFCRTVTINNSRGQGCGQIKII